MKWFTQRKATRSSAPFSPLSEAALRKAGWYPERRMPAMLDEFETEGGSLLVQPAKEFVIEFGGLMFPNLQNFITANFSGHLPFKTLLESTLGMEVSPVARIAYASLGEDVLWIDEKGRFYMSSVPGIDYFGADYVEALEVLLGGRPKPTPPPELAEAMAAIGPKSNNPLFPEIEAEVEKRRLEEVARTLALYPVEEQLRAAELRRIAEMKTKPLFIRLLSKYWEWRDK